MITNDYDRIIRENFDMSDANTRRYIVALEDAGKEQLLSALSSALYNDIVSKVEDIDFGSIPMSRGDITKVEGFGKTEQCLNTIRQLVLQYKENPSIVDIVLTAIQNIKDRKSLFIKGYALNMEFPMLMYNLMVLSVERSVSLMIATCIQYIKDPATSSMKHALDKVAYKKTMDDVLFQQLVNFNNMCKNKQLDKLLENIMKNPVREDVEFSVDSDGVEIEPSTANDVDDSNLTDCDPFDTDSTVEPFKQEDAPQENPAPEDETIPTNKVDQYEGFVAGDEVSENPDDQEVDIEIEDDSVEPENIPTVTPNDGTGNTDDTPINEEEIKEGKLLDTLKDINATINTPKDELDNSSSKFAKPVKLIKNIGFAAFVTTVGYALIRYGIIGIIRVLRCIASGFLETKAKFSDYLAVQAEFIEANANELEYSTSSELTEEKKAKVVAKQKKSAERLRKWSNFFSIDKKKTENAVKKAVEEEEKAKKTIGVDEDGDDALF